MSWLQTRNGALLPLGFVLLGVRRLVVDELTAVHLVLTISGVVFFAACAAVLALHNEPAT